MQITWKRWAILLAAVAVLGLGMGLVVWRVVVPPVRASMALGPFPPERTVRQAVASVLSDGDTPIALDAEKIMGLALVAPPVEPERPPECDWDDEEFENWSHQWNRARLDQFAALSAKALQRTCDDPELARQLELIVVQAWASQLIDGEHVEWVAQQLDVPSEGASTDELTAQLWPIVFARWRKLDGDSVLLGRMQAMLLLEEALPPGKDECWEGPGLPSQCFSMEYRPGEGFDPVGLAGQVEEILGGIDTETPGGRTDKRRHDLSLRALEQLYPGQRAACRFALSLELWPEPFSDLESSTWKRGLCKRLIFLGDRLAGLGHDAPALKMYRQAYTIARGAVLSNDPGSSFIDLLCGTALVQLHYPHLVEFWSARGDAVKTTAVESWGSCFTRTTSRIVGRGFPGPGADPTDADDEGYIALARVGMLWLGLALLGAGGAVLSLLTAGWYVICRRWRHPTSVTLGKPILVVVMLLPLVTGVWAVAALHWTSADGETPMFGGGLGSLQVPALGIIFAGLVTAVAATIARRRALAATGARRWIAGWVWPTAGLCFVLSPVVWLVAWGGEAMAEPLLLVVLPIAEAALGFWAVGAIAHHALCNTPKDKAYRAAAGKTFAFLDMLVSAVCLAGSLALSGVCAARAEAYMTTAANYREHEAQRIMDDTGWFSQREPWPERFEDLDPRVFTLEPMRYEPTSQPESQPAEKNGPALP